MTWENSQRCAKVVSRIGIDIGISCIKVVCSSRETSGDESPVPVSFLSFGINQSEDCLAMIRKWAYALQSRSNRHLGIFLVSTTGSRASKLWNQIQSIPGVCFQVHDEFRCLAAGIEFIVTTLRDEVLPTGHDGNQISPSLLEYPYLLVNVGSGVSFIRVSRNGEFERVGGTSLSGATACSILSMLTTSRHFDEMLDLAEQGDNSKTDKLISDIYATDYSGIGMKMTAVASSFGKGFRTQSVAETNANGNTTSDYPVGHSFKEADVCRSLIFAVFNNIGQLANLHAELHNITSVYFTGPYIRGHRQTIGTLSRSVEHYSSGGKKAYFLRHDSMGALGALLLSWDPSSGVFGGNLSRPGSSKYDRHSTEN